MYSGVYSSLRDTVFNLIDRYRNQGYHLFMDNYYNSVSLAIELYESGVHVSGTLRLVRGAPQCLKKYGHNQNLLQRGQSDWRRKGPVFVICWKGTRLVPMITTSYEPIQENIIHRQRRRVAGRMIFEEVEMQRPTVIGHYNQHMGGVDLFDQLVQYYPFTRTTKRWTHKFLKYILQLAIQNAYILYCGYTDDARKMSHMQFIEMCSDALINFDIDAWPVTSAPIPRVPDLPLDQRAPERRGPAPPPSSSETESDVDDPEADIDAPATPAQASAAAASPATPAATPASPAQELPSPPPRGRVIDPPGRMLPGNHSLIMLEGARTQKRCRVCVVSGVRRDTRFICTTCKVPLCRINDCATRYHTLAQYWRPVAPGSTRQRQDPRQ